MLYSYKKLTLFLAIVMVTHVIVAQNFITGADLSYTNTILEKGGEYRNQEGVLIDPYQYFSEQGSKMVRLRLLHTPENIQDFCGNPISSSNLDDVLLAAQRIHSNGMGLNLSIHYGDYFNDPGKQLRPNAWEGLAHQVLLDSIYQYTFQVLERLYEQNTTPYIVSIGNETTNGFIDTTTPTNGFSWPEDTDKFNAGLNAVDDFNRTYSQQVLKAIHLTENTAKWVTGEFINNGVTNFEVIGVSYYPFFSSETSLDNVGTLIRDLIHDYSKIVMLFETGFIWTNANADNYNNFIGNNGNVVVYPTSASGQKDFLLDLCRVVSDNGGMGVFYWEAGWISSEMCDKWGQGSSYENASFFNFNKENMPLPAFDFFQFDDTLSVNQKSLQDQIKISPNPFSSKVSISYELLKPEKVRLHIYDISGALIATISRNHLSGKQQIVWDACEFPNGTYYFKLQIESRIVCGKLLKIR